MFSPILIAGIIVIPSLKAIFGDVNTSISSILISEYVFASERRDFFAR